MPCHLCDDTCGATSVGAYTTGDLAWLWAQLADAADRRGDPQLTVGTATITAPPDVAGRAAAAGLLGRRHLVAGRRTRIDLAALTGRLAPLTPGAVAAHATGRRLAQRAANAAARAQSEAALRDRLAETIPAAAADDAWAALRRGGWVSRSLNSDEPALVDRAARVIGLLPDPGVLPVDRRVLAHAATADPHALDAGRTLPGLVLAILCVTGRLEAGLPAREAWTAHGVRYDDIVGGLTVVGIVPAGWAVPARAPVTLPPRVLATCDWPEGDGAVFVTENPSVFSAAVDIGGARVICTTGTPAGVEVAAIARLAEAGWHLNVRADFDDAGIGHMNAILTSAHTAQPWRMAAGDYLAGLACSDATVPLRLDRLGATPWDPQLAPTMAGRGVAVYEESLLDALLSDMTP